MATIYDIAKISGTSAATVSYVLNGRGEEKRISKPTQEKILAAAERLNYRPNPTARQLKTVQNPGIRIAAFWPEFYFEQSMISAMRAIKNSERCRCDLCQSTARAPARSTKQAGLCAGNRDVPPGLLQRHASAGTT